MKILHLSLVVASLCLPPAFSDAQANTSNPFPRTISVDGSAEIEVVPDEVYVDFQITEYNKKGEGKQDIDTLKRRFLSACRVAGVPDSNIIISGYGGQSDYKSFKRRNPDLIASMTFQVMFQESRLLDRVTELLDDESVSSFSIVAARHSKASVFRKELKISALKAAKEKAGYLCAAVGEELGQAITIEEDGEDIQSLSSVSVAVSQMSNNVYRASEPKKEDVSVAFKRIKFRYTMKAVFALK